MANNTEDVELLNIHSLIHQPSYELVYPETEMENGYQVARRILDWHQQEVNRRVNKVLDEVEEYSWDFGTPDGMNVRRVIDLSAIEQVRKDLVNE